MKKIWITAAGAVMAAGMAACGGHDPATVITGGGNTISQSAVSPLRAHFHGTVTADQFVCWDDQISLPGTAGTASGGVSIDQWELSHLGGKLSGWLVKEIRAAQKHSNNAQDLARASVRMALDCKAKVPIPVGWNSQGPKESS